MPKSAEVIEKLTGKALSRPIETRWNSLYDALREIIRIKPHLEEIQHTLNVPCTFVKEEFLYIEEFLKCSEPVAEAIDKLQTTNTNVIVFIFANTTIFVFLSASFTF